MANNQFNAMFSIQFESLASVQKKLDNLTKVINNQANIKLGIDTNEISKAIQNLSNLTKQNITIMDNGQIKAVSQFNDELGRTVKLKQDITNNKMDISVDQNFEKQAKEQRKATEQMYKDMFDSIEQQNQMYKKMQSDKIKSEITSAKESNRILNQNYKNEQDLINQMANAREKSELRTREEVKKTAKAQADAINKNIELEQKQRIKDNTEENKAKRLIALEKQKLELKLKNIEINRKGLVDKDSSTLLGNKIGNLNGTNTDTVRRQVQLLNIELQKLDQQSKLKGLQVGQTNISSLGSALQSTAMKLGIFTTSAAALQQLTRVVRDSYEYVRYLDKSYTDLNITMDISRGQFEQTTLQVQKMGREMGASSRAIMDVARVYSNASTNINDVLKRVEPTMWLSNVSRMDSQEVTKVVQSTINQFKLMQEEGANVVDVTERVGNSLVSISKNMEFDFGQGIYELTDAVKTAGSVAEVSGQSMESFMAMVGATIVQSGKSGSEIASAYKMISARVLQQKQLAEAEGITEEEMAKAEKTLKQYNISIREGNGDLKSLDGILLNLSKSWTTMSDSEKQYVANTMAGVRQSSTFVSIMESMTEQQRLYGQAIGDTNSLQEAQEKYVNSLEGRLGSLSSTYESLLSQILNSSSVLNGVDFASGILSGTSKLIDTFGLLPTVIGSATMAFTLFNTKARENMMFFANSVPVVGSLNTSLGNTIKRLNANAQELRRDIALRKEFILYSRLQGQSTASLNFELLKQQGRLMATVAGMVAAKVATIALQAAMSMGLSLAITVVTTGLTKLGSELFGAGSKMDDCASQARALADSLNSINTEKELVSRFGDLRKQLDDTNLSEQERTNLNKQLEEVKSRLASSESDYAWILNDETLTLDEQLSKMKQMYELNLKNKAIALDDEMYSQGKAQRIKESVENDIKQYEELKKSIANADSDGNTTYQGHATTSETLKRILGEVTDRIKENSLELDRYNGNVKLMEQANIDTGRSILNLEDNTKSLVNEVNNSTEALQKNTEAKKDNATATQGGYVAPQEISIEDATKKYGEAISKAKEYQDVVNQINKEQGLTPEIVADLASKYPELGSKVTDVVAVQEFLNQKQKEQVNIQSEMYQIMAGNDEVYYNTKLANSTEFQNQVNEYAKQFVDVNGKAYTFDVRNYKTLNELKADMNNKLGDSMGRFIAQFTGGNAEAYSHDLKQFKTLAESKAYILAQLNTEIKKIQDNMKSIAQEIDAGNDDLNLEKRYDRYSNKLANMQNGIKEINTSFDTFNASFSGMTPNFSGSDFSGGSGSSSQKEVADIELKIEKYQALTDALEDLEQQIKLTQIAQEQATTDDERLKYYQKEIDLINQQIELKKQLENQMKNDANSLKNSLGNQGVQFDSNGNISNYEAILKAKQDYANSLSGSAKEEAKKNAEEFSKQLEEYRKLTQQEIPKVESEWKSLQNTIKNTQEKMTDIIKTELEKQHKARVDALNKAKDLYNKQNSEDDYNDERASKERELAKIEADMNRLANDTSREGKLRYQQLLAEYEARQKELNDFIKDNQRNEINDRFDQEKELIDKQLEDQLNPDNLAKLVQDALANGLASIGSETLKVDSAMSSFVDNSKKGITNVTLATELLNKQLLQTQDALKNINSLYATVGMSGTMTPPSVNPNTQGRNYQPMNNNQTSNNIEIKTEVTINGGDPNELRKEFEKRDKALLNRIAKELTNH